MLNLPILTSRLRLRQLDETDVGAVHAVLGDPVTTADVSFGQANPADSAAWIERRLVNQREHGVSMLAVEVIATGELIGLCGFFPHDGTEVELGYVIRADMWRRGLASEAVSAALTAAHDAGLEVFATIRSTNVASLAVARAVGLSETGHVDDERGRLLVFALT